MDLRRWTSTAIDAYQEWADGFGPFEPHPSLVVSEKRFTEAFGAFADRLHDNYPFFHPRYAGQMLKPPHPAAIAGYLAALQINPNNHALDGGPATARMEKEVVAQLATMFGFGEHLGHLTTSGTIANLEALFVARESHPGLGVAYSADSHYTHARMCHLLGVEGHSVPTTGDGRMDLGALEELLARGRIGTVVLTAGTTGLGAVDPVHEALALRERYGVRLHVDAAYGGFFTLLADVPPEDGGVDPEPWRAIAHCDSVVVDPHKHGLQPYGCGAVLYRDPAVGRHFAHDSPYTYFTSDELHLGEISLECSRAGAAAAALWLTFRLLPPTPDGLGAVLRPGRRAALRWASLLTRSEVLVPYQPPQLDIVTYLPRLAEPALSAIGRVSSDIMARGMSDKEDPVFLATYAVTGTALRERGHTVTIDAARGSILRSVLMKPESEAYLDRLHARIEDLAAVSIDGGYPS
ncbi:aminotransferase class I/II-fold pyridoxal phosphate-dependent enzyme [Actinoplanes sp. NPDC049802]|uniref:pyridoxal phosphate-dependent decarboxylase family protein n=1 Tax=Actinoplanes sp. NPDC049802 TaxID=3154742 RepID=UPI0033EDD5E2